MTTFVNPTPFLAELTGSAVVVRLKWGMEYKGVLRSTDKHMNLQVSRVCNFFFPFATERAFRDAHCVLSADLLTRLPPSAAAGRRGVDRRSLGGDAGRDSHPVSKAVAIVACSDNPATGATMCSSFALPRRPTRVRPARSARQPLPARSGTNESARAIKNLPTMTYAVSGGRPNSHKQQNVEKQKK